MDIEADASNFDGTAISRRVGEATERKIANPLDGNARSDANYGKENKGGEVREDDEPEDECRVERRHVVEARASQRQLPGCERIALDTMSLNGWH
jgi:hypothetical protein